MPGYSNRVVHLTFPELSTGTDDPIWVSIRNPRLISPEELRLQDTPLDANGHPLDVVAAQNSMFEVFAKLIVGWRVYDPSTINVDSETGQELEMERLPSPATVELVRKLPMVIINRLSKEFKEAMDPLSAQVQTITSTSSSSPNQSMTEPGLADPSPVNSVTSS